MHPTTSHHQGGAGSIASDAVVSVVVSQVLPLT